MESYENISDDLKKKSWLGYGPEIDNLTSIHKVLNFIYAKKKEREK